jgi:FAD synthase
MEMAKIFLGKTVCGLSGKPLVMTIGTFEDRHIGHKKVINGLQY